MSKVRRMSLLIGLACTAAWATPELLPVRSAISTEALQAVLEVERTYKIPGMIVFAVMADVIEAEHGDRSRINELTADDLVLQRDGHFGLMGLTGWDVAHCFAHNLQTARGQIFCFTQHLSEVTHYPEAVWQKFYNHARAHEDFLKSVRELVAFKNACDTRYDALGQRKNSVVVRACGVPPQPPLPKNPH